jgi:hypothetical protein
MATNELEQSYLARQQGGVVVQSTSSREMEEVKAQIFMAKQFPRNPFESERRILDACKRPSLAKTAIYQYPKGGSVVQGPSIRLAEVAAQNWGNIDFGVKELEQTEGESKVLAYAWDLETNTRQTKLFTMAHSYKSHGKIKKLTDERDIYEHVANLAARRERACILGIIPGDIIEKAVEQCYETLAGKSDKPLKDRVSEMLAAFKNKFGVTQDQIEERFGYKASSFNEYDLINAGNIFNLLKDGMSHLNDWFDDKKSDEKKKNHPKNDLVDDFDKAEKGKEKKDAKPSGNKTGKETSEPEQGELPFD